MDKIYHAGHYIPQLAKLVYERNVKGVESPEINLKGVMVRAVVYFNRRNGRISVLRINSHNLNLEGRLGSMNKCHNGRMCCI